jgi:hypothetical protein
MSRNVGFFSFKEKEICNADIAGSLTKITEPVVGSRFQSIIF